MADPHAVPLPPSRGSLDSNRGGDYTHSTLQPPQLDSLAEHDTTEPEGGPEAQENGHEYQTERQQGSGELEEEDERIRILEDELERTRQDRDAWEQQYQSLLAKLTTMRQTVGDKIKQDAVSLSLPSFDPKLLFVAPQSSY